MLLCGWGLCFFPSFYFLIERTVNVLYSHVQLLCYNTYISLCYKLGYYGGFPGGSDSKESAYNVEDLGLISGLGRCPGGGNGLVSLVSFYLSKIHLFHLNCQLYLHSIVHNISNSLMLSLLSLLLLITWHAAVHGVAKSRTWLSDWTEVINNLCLLSFISG